MKRLGQGYDRAASETVGTQSIAKELERMCFMNPSPRTLKRFVTFLFVVAMLLAGATHPAPVHAAGDNQWGCSALAAYQGRLQRFIVRDIPDHGSFGEEMKSLPPDQIHDLAAELIHFHQTLDRMEQKRMVPRAALEMHHAMSQYFDASGKFFDAYAINDVPAMMAYSQAAERAKADFDRGVQLGQQRCGSGWPFNSGTPS